MASEKQVAPVGRTMNSCMANFQMVVQLGSHPHGLGEASCSCGQNHELLHGQLSDGGTARIPSSWPRRSKLLLWAEP